MNREIKFRGKLTDDNDWNFGDLRQKNGKLYIFPQGELTFKHFAYEVYPDTVGQYTGLKDKNGVEIYPGDILFSKGKIIGYVVDGVRAYCYDVMYINHPNGEKRWTLWGTVTVDYEGDIEVKGNIYDNPELLKVNNHE